MLRMLLKWKNGRTLYMSSCHRALNVNPNVLLENNVNEKDGHLLKRKINEIVHWYEELSGMDEVRMMQNRVIEAQERFAKAQEQRREANKALNKIQHRLKEISSELDTTTRGETRYLQLITQEHEILKEERRLNTEFALLEREERESFTLLSSFVKESHQKERSQAERTKYWSIIGSVVGTIIGLAGSSISNKFKMKELKELVKETSLKTASLTQLPSSDTLIQHEKELSTLLSDLKVIVSSYEDKNDKTMVLKLDEVLQTVNNDKEIMVNQKVEHLQDRIEELKRMLTSVQTYDGQLVAMPPDFEDLLNRQRNETRIVVAGFALFCLIVPIVISRFQG